MIKIGDEASFSKTMTEFDVYSFAGITGDFNPVHTNRIAAENSRFGRQICHGMLVSSFISTVLGMRCPGPGTIYLEQSMRFEKPVYIGDTITAKVKVVDIQQRVATLRTTVVNQDEVVVIAGSAKVLIDER